MDAVSTTPDQSTALDDALADFTSVLAADGYTSEWDLDADGRILATGAACAECLVPKVVLEAILNTALEGSGYELADVRLPTETA
jgi:hypothetical protein